METDHHLPAEEQAIAVPSCDEGDLRPRRSPLPDSILDFASTCDAWSHASFQRRDDSAITLSASVQQELERKLALAEANLTEAREEQARLVEKISTLEELQRRTCAAALAEAEHLSQLKTEFINNMNHELRTPLFGIIGMANIGLKATDGIKTRLAFHRILEAARQLSEMIVNVLDFSSLDAGCLAFKPTSVDLGEVIEAAARQASIQATVKDLEFANVMAGNLPRCCWIDRSRLGSVLSHLLDNATKFTEKGSVNLISKRDGAWLVFVVADTGIGLSSEHVRCLFRPFEQADGSASRRFGGMGLSLALTNRLVQQMGGTIQVDSALGKGASFEVRLPFIEPPEEMSDS